MEITAHSPRTQATIALSPAGVGDKLKAEIPGRRIPLATHCRATVSARDGVKVDVSTELRHF